MLDETALFEILFCQIWELCSLFFIFKTDIRRQFQTGLWMQYRQSPHQTQMHLKVFLFVVSFFFGLWNFWAWNVFILTETSTFYWNLGSHTKFSMDFRWTVSKRNQTCNHSHSLIGRLIGVELFANQKRICNFDKRSKRNFKWQRRMRKNASGMIWSDGIFNASRLSDVRNVFSCETSQAFFDNLSRSFPFLWAPGNLHWSSKLDIRRSFK